MTGDGRRKGSSVPLFVLAKDVFEKGMKYMNAKYKPIALYILENYTDDIMAEAGFKRRGNSMNYFRTVGTTKQKLEMVYYSHPSYYAGALLHIYPFMSVYFPDIHKMAENMIDDVGEITVFRPIKEKPFDSSQWILITDEKEEVDDIAGNIRIFLKQCIIPLFDDLQTIDDYIDRYEQNDERAYLNGIQGYFYVASAYVIKGEYAKGLEVLNKRFVGPAIRKYHAKAFAYFETKLGE